MRSPWLLVLGGTIALSAPAPGCSRSRPGRKSPSRADAAATRAPRMAAKRPAPRPQIDVGTPERPPRVNGIAWRPKPAPFPERLPRLPVGGVVDYRPFVPTRITFQKRRSEDEGWELSFFQSEDTACRAKRADELGFGVVTGPSRVGSGVRISARPNLMDTRMTPWAYLTVPTGPLRRQPSAVPFVLHIDRLTATTVTGRIYIASPTRERDLLVGEFQGRVCPAAGRGTR